MPVHRGGVIEPVGDGNREFVADVGADQWARDGIAGGQGLRQGAAQVDGGPLRRQRGSDGAPGVRTRCLGSDDGGLPGRRWTRR